MAARKQYPLRIDPEVWDAVQAWADDEFRSVNAQVEWILRDALRRAGRLKKTMDQEVQEPSDE
ncbi:MAG: Arc family DNA-binding protein [Coriobacteriales bacterium]|nr:Arc family DNA-binding protein [Coriobacteriales bacterium]